MRNTGRLPNIDIVGGAEREVHVLLNRDRLSAAGLSIVQVAETVGRGILTVPAGRVREANREYNVRYDAEFARASDIGGLQVVGGDGARRYIRDLGRVEEIASDEIRQASFIDGRPCIGIQVIKRADANAVEVVDAVRCEVENLAGILPGGTDLVWVTDDAGYIRATVATTGAAIVAGIILTAAVLFLFLFNARSALVVAVSMPVTVVISLFFMRVSGFTLNVVTLQALALSVGTLVTNSIMVMESVASRLREGDAPWDAAREGTARVAIAVLAAAGTNMVVLLPIGMMGEVVGMLFRPFALTTLYANLTSVFISFTLTPILCGLFLARRREGGLSAKMGDAAERALQAPAALLARFLRVVGARRWLAGLLAAGSLALFLFALTLTEEIGFEMFPSIDKGQMSVKLEYPTYQNLDHTVARVKEVEERLRDLPGLIHIATDVGKINAAPGNPSEGTYLVGMTVVLEDRTRRPMGMDEVMDRVRELLADHRDCIVTPSRPDITGDEDIPIQLRISGGDLGELHRIASAIRQELRNTPGFADVSTNIKDEREEIRVRPNRPVLADAAIEPDWLGDYLRTGIDGAKVALFRSGGRSFDIRVKYEEREGADQVRRLQVPVRRDKNVPLGQYAAITTEYAPVIISRSDRSRMAMVFAFLDPDYPMSTAMERIETIITEKELLPPGYSHAFMGMEEWLEDSLTEFAEAALTALVLTYLMLSAVLESFRRSLYIMITIPLGLIGVLLALYLAGLAIDMFVLLGCVLLIGIVVNDVVLVMDRAETLRLGGVPAGEALIQAITGEFRPVIMITFAAVFGMLPLALATDQGCEFSIGIGVASVGGILVSAGLTYIVMPAFFLLFNPLAKRK